MTVLIVTGGLLTSQERSLGRAAWRWLLQLRRSRAAWLDVKVKLTAAEPMVAARLARRTASPSVRAWFDQPAATDIPSLTSVVLQTLLEQVGMACDSVTIDEVFSGQADAALRRCDWVFLSTTYLHDLSELETVLDRLPHPRIVVGGALMGIIDWEGHPQVAAVAVGYGELLVEPLVAWMRGGALVPPAGGRLVQRQHSIFVYSGVPSGESLDMLPTPQWRPMQTIYYESVRGCPYRCSFCNYPYLFDDTRFRYKSATRMADDWEQYVQQGVETIICLDSLFTMPRRRLQAFCRQLLERRLRVRWVCYARADDLDDETVVMMREAGCVQVQIGIESGDEGMLANMNKACRLEANRTALRNCRRHGLTTVVSLIVGFPGETAATLENTYRFLSDTPPDFYFLATFSTRVEGVPVLQPESRRRFGLDVMPNLYSMAPYWKHDTMSCADVGNYVRALDRRLMQDRVSLNAAVFFPGIMTFDPRHREELLDFQCTCVSRGLLQWLFNGLNAWVDQRLRASVLRELS